MLQHFVFKGNRYLTGTVVKIHDKKRKKFEYNAYLKFIKICDKQCYKFCALHNCWEIFTLTQSEIDMCVEKVVTPINLENVTFKSVTETHDIDGIVPAWTWFILALIASLLMAGMINKLLMPITAFSIFVIWRHNKIKGE